MGIALTCDCGKHFTVSEHIKAAKVRCPKCDEFVRIPPSSASPSPPEKEDEADAHEAKTKPKKKTKRDSGGRNPAIKWAVVAGVALVMVGVLILGTFKGIQWAKDRGASAREQQVRDNVQRAVDRLGTAQQAEAVPAVLLENRQLALPLLIEVMTDKDASRRLAAAQILDAMGTDAKEAAPSLTKAINDEDVRVQVLAVTTLGKLGTDGRGAVAPLATRLKAASAARTSARAELKREINALADEQRKGWAKTTTKLLDSRGKVIKESPPYWESNEKGPDGKWVRSDRDPYLPYQERIAAIKAKDQGLLIFALMQTLGKFGRDAKAAAPAVAEAATQIHTELKEENEGLAAEKRKGWRLVRRTKGTLGQNDKVLYQEPTSHWEATSGEVADRDPRLPFEERIAALTNAADVAADTLRRIE